MIMGHFIFVNHVEDMPGNSYFQSLYNDFWDFFQIHYCKLFVIWVTITIVVYCTHFTSVELPSRRHFKKNIHKNIHLTVINVIY